jgi:5-methylcytosine-specific restriction endonuclease McrA
MSISRKIKRAFGIEGPTPKSYQLRTFLRHAFETADGLRVKCWLCGALLDRKSMTVDHVLRRRDGGKHNSKNLRPACLGCNRRRN